MTVDDVVGVMAFDVPALRAQLLAWYDAEGRALPWRVRPEDRARGVVPQAYLIWLSEVMSQQTTLAHATPYWEKFCAAFPTVRDLADADRAQILAMWAGLGYYARARNLHKAAQSVRDDFGGVFPTDEATLLRLPGIGPYTAATIAAICADEATNIVDGNVERVIARIFAVETPLPKAKPCIRALAQSLVRPDRPGDYGQALMDLGALICTPRSPDCPQCPWQGRCAAYGAGEAELYPKRLKKTPRPIRHGFTYILRCGEMVWLEERPDKGLLGGMMGLPTTKWGAEDHPIAHDSNIHMEAPFQCEWAELGQVKHVFTHFELRLRVFRAVIEPKKRIEAKNRVWAADMSVLPSVFAKAIKLERTKKAEP